MDIYDKGHMPPAEGHGPHPDDSPEGRGGKKPGPRWVRTFFVFLALFVAGVLGGYLFFSKGVIREPKQAQKAGPAKANT